MRQMFTFSLLVLTQSIWLWNSGAHALHCPTADGQCDDMISAAAQQSVCSAVETEFEESEFFHQADVTVIRGDFHGGFRVLLSARPLICLKIDARGCRPPPSHG